VRSANPKDASAIGLLLGELGYPTDGPEVEVRLERLDPARGSGALAAAKDGTVLGVLAYQHIDLLERPGRTCRITALVTQRGHRRQGIATRLLEALGSLAWEAGCDRFEVATRPERDDALAFYLRSGFTERPRRLVRPIARSKSES